MDQIPFYDAAGKVSSATMDLQALVTTRMLIQANSGGGKSHALRYILEQTHGQIPQIIIDPEGEFASLREQFPYILIGEDGDLPADPARAGILCRRLVELDASAIVDLYELRPADRRRYVRRFVEALMQLPRALWRPILVVIDECHVFAPERGSGEAESLEAVIALATQGRKRGFALLAATQRLSKLHKDVAAELLNVLIGRTGLDVDLRRAGDILGFDREQRQALKFLDPGTFYCFGPAVSRDVIAVRTGTVITTHPEAGALALPAPPPPAELREILQALRDLPLDPAPPTDLDSARRTIARLERQLADRTPMVERVEVPTIASADLDRLGQLIPELASVADRLITGLAHVQQTAIAAADVDHVTPAPAVDEAREPADIVALLETPGVRARIQLAGAKVEKEVHPYMRRILILCWDRTFAVSEFTEGRGTLSASSRSRWRRASQALASEQLILIDDQGRIRTNRDELERLRRLHAQLG